MAPGPGELVDYSAGFLPEDPSVFSLSFKPPNPSAGAAGGTSAGATS